MAIRTKSALVTLTATAAQVLASADNEALTIAKALACNTDTSARTISVYHDVTGSDGAVATTQIIRNKSIAPGDTIPLPLSSLFVINGGKLWAVADVAGKVNLDISYNSADQTKVI